MFCLRKSLIILEYLLGLGIHTCVCLLEKCVEIDLLKLIHNKLDLGLSLRMLGSEDGATILKGENRGIEGAVVSCIGDDLVLVKTDAGTEYGDVDHTVGNTDSGKGLRGNLAEALTGDERAALIFVSASFCKSHHEDTKENGEVILLALVTQLLLHVGKRDNVYVYSGTELAHFLGKL